MSKAALNEILKDNKPFVKLLNLGRALARFLQKSDMPFFISYFNMNNLKFIYVGDSVKNVLGYEPEEMEGQRFDKFLIEKEDFEKSVNAVENNLKQGEAVSYFVNTYRTKAGGKQKLVWFSDATDDGRTLNFAFPIEFFNNINTDIFL